MAAGAGSLTVSVGLDAAEFGKGLTKAQQQLQDFSASVAKIAAGVALGEKLGDFITEAVKALPELVTGAIEAAARLDDLSKKTGIAADTLGGIGFAAKQAGGDLDSAVSGANKLNKALAEATAGNKDLQKAFSLVGISAKELVGLNTADAMAKVADAFAAAEDGPQKTAIAIALFGKAGADMIPVLDKGGEALKSNIAFFQQYSGVTNESAEAANRFTETQAKIALVNASFGQNLSQELLPTLQTLASTYLDIKENSTLMGNAASGLGDLFKGLVVIVADLSFVIVQAAKGVGALGAAFIAFENGDFKSIPTIFKEYAADVKVAYTALDTFVDKVLAGQSVLKQAPGTDPSAFAALDFVAPQKKKLGNLNVAGAAADDPTKKLLDAQLKAIENAIAEEKALLASRNQFIDFYNAQGLLSIQDYYGARKTAQTAATKGEIEGYNAEIAALIEFQDKSTTSKKDQADSDVRITELLGKRAAAEKAAGAASILAGLEQQKALDDLEKSVRGVTGQVLELDESFAAAAAVKFDLANDALSKTFTANGNQAGLTAIATLREAAIAQGAFQKVSIDSGRTLADLQDQEDRIALAQATGAKTSLQALVAVGNARKAQIPILEAQVAAEEAIAKASNDPGLIQNAEAARLALDKLKASADPLADSLNKAFGSDAQSALDDFVTGSKTASQAFSSFAKSVLADILKLGDKSLVESIFGGGSGGGGLGGLFSSLFGGSGGNLNAPGAASDAGNGFGSSGSSAGGFLSTIGSFFSGFFADGGTIAPGQWGVVGENGPEVAFGGKTGKTIHPMASGSAQTINVHVAPPPGQTRDTTLQQGADLGRAVQRSLARGS